MRFPHLCKLFRQGKSIYFFLGILIILAHFFAARGREKTGLSGGSARAARGPLGPSNPLRAQGLFAPRAILVF
jgi:hypothetical protein